MDCLTHCDLCPHMSHSHVTLTHHPSHPPPSLITHHLVHFIYHTLLWYLCSRYPCSALIPLCGHAAMHSFCHVAVYSYSCVVVLLYVPIPSYTQTAMHAYCHAPSQLTWSSAGHSTSRTMNIRECNASQTFCPSEVQTPVGCHRHSTSAGSLLIPPLPFPYPPLPSSSPPPCC